MNDFLQNVFVHNSQYIEMFDIIFDFTNKVFFFIAIFFDRLDDDINAFFFNAYIDNKRYVVRKFSYFRE